MKKCYLYNSKYEKDLYDYIIKNEIEFKKKFNHRYEFIRDYPGVLEYLEFEPERVKKCPCCGHYGTVKEATIYKNGNYPPVKDFSINLYKLSNMLIDYEYLIKDTYFKNEALEFIAAFKKYF